MQSQHDSCSRLSAAPPGRSSVCLAAGEVLVPVRVKPELFVKSSAPDQRPCAGEQSPYHALLRAWYSYIQAQLEGSSEGAFSFWLLPYPYHPAKTLSYNGPICKAGPDLSWTS
ncbi:hypothetical protein GGI35DRAFT_441485 [Trichoderma velutinum]